MWSKIQNTELATEAYILMNENEINGCQYHNNDHILAMYRYLEDSNEPYDKALDWAVMFHDIVYDSGPNKERRSMELFLEMKSIYRGCDLSEQDISRVCVMILATIGHMTTHNSGIDAIIRADLHALTDPKTTVENFVKIMQESLALYEGIGIYEYAHNTIGFMTKLRTTMVMNKQVVDQEHIMFYNLVISGIDRTIRLAKAIGG